MRASQAVVGKLPGDYTLRDRAGQPVSPVPVSRQAAAGELRLHRLLPGLPDQFARAVQARWRRMRGRFGVEQFKVVSIGFNQPTDSPLALRDFAAQQRINDPNWEFLSPRADDVAALARDFGFSYVATPIGFDHTLQVSILDADGRIHRQVYGDAFTADSLGEPLKQLVTGSLGTVVSPGAQA